MNILLIDTIRREARQAAEQELGPQANRYAIDICAYKEWNRAYYERVQELSTEAVL